MLRSMVCWSAATVGAAAGDGASVWCKGGAVLPGMSCNCKAPQIEQQAKHSCVREELLLLLLLSTVIRRAHLNRQTETNSLSSGLAKCVL